MANLPRIHLTHWPTCSKRFFKSSYHSYENIFRFSPDSNEHQGDESEIDSAPKEPEGIINQNLQKYCLYSVSVKLHIIAQEVMSVFLHNMSLRKRLYQCFFISLTRDLEVL